MSCCSKGCCNFKFEEGPPLVDNSVTNLNAQYQFLPYGTILEVEEVVRIWMESGATKTVILEEKIPLVMTDSGPESEDGKKDFPWQLVALDSGIEYEDLMNWKHHDLYNPNETSVLLKFNHPIEVKPSLKMKLLKILYKIRNL
ncbi:hypothetical protein MNBD_GAMMA04-1647 [hydrothermal vent metagenome]|uniref:Uncharacterized protein n=1 Tax=hydrothermal vent metagenome TaxID=652676 RepID=A0A3B0VLS5_9ZZZZ